MSLSAVAGAGGLPTPMALVPGLFFGWEKLLLKRHPSLVSAWRLASEGCYEHDSLEGSEVVLALLLPWGSAVLDLPALWWLFLTGSPGLELLQKLQTWLRCLPFVCFAPTEGAAP